MKSSMSDPFVRSRHAASASLVYQQKQWNYSRTCVLGLSTETMELQPHLRLSGEMAVSQQ